MAQASSPTRVLVIDDDEMSRELLAVLLETEGYAVSSADSGDAALSLLESGTLPGLILTDMQMPGSTPMQLAGRLRRACGRSAFLLAMSGSQPASATLARYDGFLLKPFGVAEFSAAIEAARAMHHTTGKAAKAPVASPRPKPSRTVKKTATKKIATTFDLAASAEKTASKHWMSTVGASSAGPVEVMVLDETIYRQLAGSMPAAQLREMYLMCLGDARARIASMRSLAAAHDGAQFMREAHAIKGSCGMLGATELHRLAAALEIVGPVPGGTAVNSLDELSHACDRLERMLSSRA